MSAPGSLVHIERDAAKMIGLSARTLQRLRLEGGGPPYIKLSAQRVGYTPKALQDWLDSRQFPSTAAAKVAKPRGQR